MAELVVKLDGGLAHTGEVPAFTALESAHGISRAMMMILYFAQTGEIRRRNFKALDTDLRLVATREGSFDLVFQFAQFAPYFVDAYATGMANVSWDLIKTIFSRATGATGSKEISKLEETGDINAGDLGALVQATEASIRRAHSVINHGANSINISINGDYNVVTLDKVSKEYMHKEIFNEEPRSQRFLVTSFDGRNRTGRLFNIDEEMGYTFDLLTDADRKSLTTIANAARAYALREGRYTSAMEIVAAFTSVDSPDGRKKRLKIYAARKEFESLPAGEFTPRMITSSAPVNEEDDFGDVIEEE